MTNSIFNLSGNELAHEICRGAPLLRHPKPSNPRKGAQWVKELSDLHQKTLLMVGRFQGGEQIPMELRQRAAGRIDKISEKIPGGWLFDSEERRLVKDIAKTIAPLLKTNAEYNRMQEKVAEECSFHIPTFRRSAMGAFLASLYFFGNLVTPAAANASTDIPTVPKTRDLCKQTNMQMVCQGNLGIPRQNMPQLKGPVLSKFLEHKSSQGKWIEMERIPADRLIPTQAELNRELVFKFIKQKGSFDCSHSPVLVMKNSTGHYAIVDGHHRAVASRLLGKDQTAIVVHDDELLNDLKCFPGVTHLPLNEDLGSPKHVMLGDADCSRIRST